ncbi:MAG: tetratricopeptide repeat protein [Verrucomicrobiota bacterium]|nr:tetratricopeptide repeat protein [Limisphaera sp.]MDW8381011.1 tetratricopeptide repeat protein [Verrucomicrobiota bacterium]
MASTATEPTWWIEAYAWAETRKRQLLWGLIGLLVLGLGVSYYLYWRGQRRIEAAWALSEAAAPALTARDQAPRASAYLAVAERFPRTQAGGHALLLAATALQQEGDLAGAQVRFEQFLREHRGSPLFPQAIFGLATLLELQGRTNEAMERYESLAERRVEMDPVALVARLRLGRLSEARGEWERARRHYEEVARAVPMSSIGGEARLALQSLLETHPELAEAPASGGPNPQPVLTNAAVSPAMTTP